MVNALSLLAKSVHLKAMQAYDFSPQENYVYPHLHALSTFAFKNFVTPPLPPNEKEK